MFQILSYNANVCRLCFSKLKLIKILKILTYLKRLTNLIYLYFLIFITGKLSYNDIQKLVEKKVVHFQLIDKYNVSFLIFIFLIYVCCYITKYINLYR